MFKTPLLILTFFILLFTGCSSHLTKKNVQLSSSKIYAIGSFWNYTETPMAGLRAASIVESVATQKGVKLYSLTQGSDELAENNNKLNFLKKEMERAKALKADYLITGEVQEWRYKTGIDGEPVVSYTIKIIQLNDGSTQFNGVGAKSGWGHKSIGIVAQEIAQELLPTFIP
jgi:uncharacterized protein YceK